MGSYPGAFSNKRQVCEVVCNALQRLGGAENYRSSQHVYLAGEDACELSTALLVDNKINTNNLHAAEENPATFERVALRVPVRFRSCLYAGRLQRMIFDRRLTGRIGVLWLDICGTIETAADIMQQIRHSLRPGAVVAVTCTYGRDGNSFRRWDIRDRVSASKWRDGGRYHEPWDAQASAMLLTERLRGKLAGRFYFPLMVAYRNVGHKADGESRMQASPMFVAVGRKTTYRGADLEPLFNLDAREPNKELWRLRETTSNSGAALKAHLPQPFKDYVRSIA